MLKFAKPPAKAAADLTYGPAQPHSVFAAHRLDRGPIERSNEHEQELDRDGRQMPGCSWNLGKILIFPPDKPNRPPPLSVSSVQPGVMHPKLAIGPVDDPLEREADAVADWVMQMPDPARRRCASKAVSLVEEDSTQRVVD
jgi:hypothetical protein